MPGVKKKMSKTSSSEQVLNQLTGLWPALKGSLAKVRRPCIRPNCPACARGDKHTVYLLAFRHKGKRRCLYVPLAMVSTIEHALSNGRKIEELLYSMGPELLLEYREKNPAKTGPPALS